MFNIFRNGIFSECLFCSFSFFKKPTKQTPQTKKTPASCKFQSFSLHLCIAPSNPPPQMSMMDCSSFKKCKIYFYLCFFYFPLKLGVGGDSLPAMIFFFFMLANWPFIPCLIQMSYSIKIMILIHGVARYLMSYNDFAGLN